MPDIRIHRDHALGLVKARKLACLWAEMAEQKFDLECKLLEGPTSDTVEFKRVGVSGSLIVAADHFDLQAKLGFLLGAFSKTIERQIEQNLDELLGAAAARGDTKNDTKNDTRNVDQNGSKAAGATKPVVKKK
jgi:putative polyhydroxyalkanoate system protein